MTDRRLALDDGSLVDLLDRLVTTGAVVDGCVIITLAGVDLARLDLRVVLASMLGRPSAGLAPLLLPPGGGRPAYRRPDGDRATRRGPQRGPQAGLAGLVLVVVDLVRQLLERLALHRMEAGELSGEEVERLGRALMSLEEQTGALAEVLGIGTAARGNI